MSVPPELIQRAIDDLATVRKAIDRGDDTKPGFASSANLLAQVTALLGAGVILGAEIVFRDFTAQVLNLTIHFPDLRLATIATIGLVLAILCAALYFIVYRASRASQRDFSRFVARNFAYLKNLSFLCDLLVKFAVVSLLIHVGKPEWVAPLLFLFVGDYLIQGRFFTLPIRIAFALGLLSIVAGVVQAYLGSSLLRWPLAGFVLVCTLSLIQVVRLRRAEASMERAVP